MDYKLPLAIVSGVLPVAAYLPYIFAIFRRKVRPNPFSWLIWSLNGFIFSAVLLTSGAGFGTITELVYAVIELVIAIMAFSRNHRRSVGKFDLVLTAFAIFAILIWIFTKDPLFAAGILAISNGLGFVITLKYDWRHPLRDDATPWLSGFLGRSAQIGSLATYNFATLIGVSVSLVADFTTMLVVLGRGKQRLMRKLRRRENTINRDKTEILRLKKELSENNNSRNNRGDDE
jgi:hypothetical protein